MTATIEIVFARIGAFDAALAGDRWRGVLAAGEQVRADRFAAADGRRRYVAGRLLLRHVLAAHMGEEPGALRLEIDGDGRPEAPDHPDLSFSLSHARTLLAVAVSRASRVGLDLEEADRVVDRDAVAAAAFTAHEVALRAAAADPAAAFLQIWTAKEAVAKAEGRGLRADPRCFGLLANLPVQAGPPAPACDHAGRQWWVHAVALPGAVCHLATGLAALAPAVRPFAG